MAKSKTPKGKRGATRVSDGREPGSSRRAATSLRNAGPARDVFPIVAIGASAGGLAAFEAFFAGMPTSRETGMAFVLIQHLSPDYKSILSELVRRYTRMEVHEVADGMEVKPECVYIIKPNRDMSILGGRLQLFEPAAPRGQRLPIDFFFRSLALDRREKAVGVVLSGTGSDGTQGVKAIKAEGGMVVVQSPETTEYDGMPQSAIATGIADFVLPPSEMPTEIIDYLGRAFGPKSRFPPVDAAVSDDALKKIFVLLRAQTGHDFSGYKPNTVARRIERRMALHRIERGSEYVAYLQRNPKEVEALFRDMLIGVTGFFRDADAFRALEEQVVSVLLAGRSQDVPLRVWVPGCSSGEEAYSIAMLLHERMSVLRRNFKAQIFATDIDERAVAFARAGQYPASIANDVSAERLARFFIRQADGSFAINKSIRESLVFSVQDVIRDPPFSKLDLISCRNLLIYMGADLQKRLIPLFHYALNPQGYLFLGTSETVGEFGNLFAVLDRKARIYARRDDRHTKRPDVGLLAHVRGPAEAISGRAVKQAELPHLRLRELTERALLDQFASVGALVTGAGDILYLHGRWGQYLEPSPGEAGNNILAMAREGLRSPLAESLRAAASTGKPNRRAGLRVKANGHYVAVDLNVRAAMAKTGARRGASSDLFAVILSEAASERKAAPAFSKSKSKAASRTQSSRQVALLKEELESRENYIRAVREELETANEDLKSSNEEMQSMNEELQSTNEELETSKEELQSVNEELSTVNNELQTKVSELSRTNNDMNNLLAGTGIGTIFVDLALNIQRFTPAVTQLINLIATDVGRPVGHIVSNIVGYERLVADIQEVLATLAPKEIEVRAKSGAWFLLRIRPYRTVDNVIEGAVITFTDITELRKAQAMLREDEAGRRLAAILRDAQDAIMVWDLDGRILAWNPGAERLYGWSESEAVGKNIHELTPQGGRDDLSNTIRKLARRENFEPYPTSRMAKDGREVPIAVTATPLIDEKGAVYAIAVTERERRHGQ